MNRAGRTLIARDMRSRDNVVWVAPLLVIVFMLSEFLTIATGQEKLTQVGMQRLLRSKIESVQELAAIEPVIRAVRGQNEKALPLDRIKEIDVEWVRVREVTPFKKSVQENEVGRHFKSMVDLNQSIYSEIFLTDRQGATVAAYLATTNYWHGDEAKWREAFNSGLGKVYIGPVEFYKSSEVNSVQICVPVIADGGAIGVLVVGVKVTYLQARYLKPAP